MRKRMLRGIDMARDVERLGQRFRHFASPFRLPLDQQTIRLFLHQRSAHAYRLSGAALELIALKEHPRAGGEPRPPRVIRVLDMTGAGRRDLKLAAALASVRDDDLQRQ